jgi:hypothetical protein
MKESRIPPLLTALRMPAIIPMKALIIRAREDKYRVIGKRWMTSLLTGN